MQTRFFSTGRPVIVLGLPLLRYVKRPFSVLSSLLYRNGCFLQYLQFPFLTSQMLLNGWYPISITIFCLEEIEEGSLTSIS